ncbi:MAG: hypothetical protein KF883_08205 [Thermomicrobiales bacterium]|nr:hypothetical protein [Thermomicrobiales bacterium]
MVNAGIAVTLGGRHSLDAGLAAMSNLRARKSIRLPEFDYRLPGNYFVTICTVRREPLFGSVRAAEMILSPFGEIVESAWHDIPQHHGGVSVDECIIMPNHLHGIVSILTDEDGIARLGVQVDDAPQMHRRNPRSGSLGAIVGSFKSASTRNINRSRGTPGAPVWQQNYYEHIIRNERALSEIRTYIAGNPAKWADDPENPYRKP